MISRSFYSFIVIIIVIIIIIIIIISIIIIKFYCRVIIFMFESVDFKLKKKKLLPRIITNAFLFLINFSGEVYLYQSRSIQIQSHLVSFSHNHFLCEKKIYWKRKSLIKFKTRCKKNNKLTRYYFSNNNW